MATAHSLSRSFLVESKRTTLWRTSAPHPRTRLHQRLDISIQLGKVTMTIASNRMQDYTTWLNECREEAQKQWCYPDLIDDHPEKFEAAFKDGESPKNFVRELGLDLDLIDFGPWK